MTERVDPVEDNVDRHALAAKPGPDRPGHDLEILDDEHSHDISPFCFLQVVTTGGSGAGRDDMGPTMT